MRKAPEKILRTTNRLRHNRSVKANSRNVKDTTASMRRERTTQALKFYFFQVWSAFRSQTKSFSPCCASATEHRIPPSPFRLEPGGALAPPAHQPNPVFSCRHKSMAASPRHRTARGSLWRVISNSRHAARVVRVWRGNDRLRSIGNEQRKGEETRGKITQGKAQREKGEEERWVM